MMRGIVTGRRPAPACTGVLVAAMIGAGVAGRAQSGAPGPPTGPAVGAQSGTSSACAAAGLEPLVPPAPPSARLPDLFYDPTRGSDPEVDLGIGYLSAVDRFDAEWPSSLTMPLFKEAAGPVSAWLVGGWLMPIDAGPRPLGVAGLVETGYEIPSFIVHDSRPDGWVRLRVERGSAGVVWTHACYFEQGSTAMRIERWETRFVNAEISPLFFRTGVPHALRAEPTENAERVRWLPADSSAYDLRPIDVRGDWMRVEVAQPSDYCAGLDAPPVARVTGWVRWRDDTRGSWVWYFTRGC
jgi:hypothetical protein